MTAKLLYSTFWQPHLIVSNMAAYETKLTSEMDSTYNLLYNWIRFGLIRFGYKSFRYYRAKLRNALPVYVKELRSSFIVKRRITKGCFTPECEKFYIE